MDVGSHVNTNQSILGSDILAWIESPAEGKSEQDQAICQMLYHKYLVDREGNPRTGADVKIHPDVYYYVNYNNHFNEAMYLAYIVRDKVRSPRSIPDSLASRNLVDDQDSYKGSTIQEWAYYHNGSATREYFIEANEIVTKYLEDKYPIRPNVYYFIQRTSKGIKLFRDTVKSPRSHEFYPSDSHLHVAIEDVVKNA